MIVGWTQRTRIGRLVAVAALLTAWAPLCAIAQQVDPNQWLMFAPTPLGVGPAAFEPVTRARGGSIPVPKARPNTAARPVARAAAPVALQTTWSKGYFDRIGGTIDTRPGGSSLASIQPQASDFSRGVDLGGVSLGLDTGHGNDGSGTKNLLSPEARDPVPTDPTIVKRGSPFLGLSLSAPTN